MVTGEVPEVINTKLNLKPPLQEAIGVILQYGGRLTAHELQTEMGIGLSTAYTYLKKLHMQDVVERLKIQSASGIGKQYLYVIKPLTKELDELSTQESLPLEHTSQKGAKLHDQPADPMEEVLDILSYLTEKVKTLEQQLKNLEQEKHKHYPLNFCSKAGNP